MHKSAHSEAVDSSGDLVEKIWCFHKATADDTVLTVGKGKSNF